MKLLVIILMLIPLATTAATSSSSVRSLGIPCAEKAWYARNVWAMAFYDDRLFVGCGNSSNLSPISNAGPVDVWTYREGFGWQSEYVVDEEQIDRFVIIGGTLAIPGHDPRIGSDLGSWYNLTDSGWQRHATIPDALHVYDLAEHDGMLFAALGTKAEWYPTIAVSSDHGETWIQQTVPVDAVARGRTICAHNGYPTPVARVYSFFTVGGDLYANTLPMVHHNCLPTGGVTSYYTSLIAHWNGEGFEPVQADFFNETEANRVVYPTIFGENTVFVAAKTDNDHQWIPLRIFAFNESLQTQPVNPPDCSRPQALSLYADSLYVLCNQLNGATWQVSVAATCDLTTWQTVMTTTMPTFARSFALAADTIFFALGVDTDARGAAQNAVGEVFASPDFTPITCD